MKLKQRIEKCSYCGQLKEVVSITKYPQFELRYCWDCSFEEEFSKKQMMQALTSKGVIEKE